MIKNINKFVINIGGFTAAFLSFSYFFTQLSTYSCDTPFSIRQSLKSTSWYVKNRFISYLNLSYSSSVTGSSHSFEAPSAGTAIAIC